MTHEADASADALSDPLDHIMWGAMAGFITCPACFAPDAYLAAIPVGLFLLVMWSSVLISIRCRSGMWPWDEAYRAMRAAHAMERKAEALRRTAAAQCECEKFAAEMEARAARMTGARRGEA